MLLNKRLIFISIFLFNNLLNTSFAQKKNPDSLKLINHSWYVSADYEKIVNSKVDFSAVGFNFSFLLRDNGFIGIYASGLISDINYIFLNNNFPLYSDKKINFAHGGLYLGIKPLDYNKTKTLFSLKIGRGAVFLYDKLNTYNYSLERDDVWVVTPMIESQLRMLNWIYLRFAIGVRIVEGFNKHFNISGKNIKLYHSSDFEGFIIGMSFKFCKS